ncbi:hypothetical protein, partial [Pseudomonas aeruginosa]
MGNPILAGLGFSLPKRQVSNHDLVGRINMDRPNGLAFERAPGRRRTG